MKFARIAYVAIVALVVAGGARAQSDEERRIVDEYLKGRGAAPASVDSAREDMFEAAAPVVPPEAPAGEPRSGRFGLDIFAHPPGDFLGPTETPVPPDYTIGPGDHLSVNLWGGVDLSLELVVDREGKVFIPRAGELVLWGLSLAEAQKRIENLLGTIYSRFRMNLVLGKIRSLKIYVTGEVKRPGAYTVSSLHTLFNTLYLAGGPTERGTIRDIRLIRGGEIVARADLYRLLLEGKEEDVRLESNDVVFVPVVMPLVTVTGEVRRPGMYELLGGERLEDAIALAGGFRSSACLSTIEVERYRDNRERVLLSLDLASARDSSNIPLADGDEIHVRAIHPLAERIVFLAGEVKYPGEYQFVDGMRVSDLVRFDGLLPHAYTRKVFLTRTERDKTRRVFTIDLDRVLAAAAAADRTPPGEAGGAAPGAVGDCGDLPLQPWDSLVVYSVDRVRDRETVRIDGEVRSPGVFDYAESMTLGDLVSLAGGTRSGAYLLKAELARLDPDSSRVSRVLDVPLGEVLDAPHSAADPVLAPGDAVFVRETPNYREHDAVWVGGEVRFPGTYVIRGEVETVRSLVERAGGLTGEAFAQGAIFQRTRIAGELENRHVPEIINSIQHSYVDTIGGVRPELLPIELRAGLLNRIVIDLPAILDGSDRADLTLEAGDRLIVPRRPSGVNVIGAVASSGTIAFRRGMKAGYYIERAGGFTRSAARDELRIIKADGYVVKRGASRRQVEIGDAIVVPERVARDRNWVGAIQSSMAIIASALTTILIVTKM